MIKVFLGGTCNGSKWREELIPQLTVEYFNPVVRDWTPECQEEEIKQRGICDYVLYAITHEMTGVYSIAEAVDDSNKRPGKTIVCVLKDGFTYSQLKSLKATVEMIEKNGGKVFMSLRDVAKYLNEKGSYKMTKEEIRAIRERVEAHTTLGFKFGTDGKVAAFYDYMRDVPKLIVEIEKAQAEIERFNTLIERR